MGEQSLGVYGLDNLSSPQSFGSIDAKPALVRKLGNRYVSQNSLSWLLFDVLSWVRLDPTSNRVVYRNVEMTGSVSATPRILGKIAEACIVQECRNEPEQNRQWAKWARRGRNTVGTPDRFMAVGTGHAGTKDDFRLSAKYQPCDSQRDIIWVHKENWVEELQMTKRGLRAGLQVKTSASGMASRLIQDLCAGRYEVPVVYFDLERDFNRVMDAVHRDKPEFDIEQNLICGSKVSAGIHERLLDFYGKLNQVLLRKWDAEKLLESEAIRVGFEAEVAEGSGFKGDVVIAPENRQLPGVILAGPNHPEGPSYWQ